MSIDGPSISEWQSMAMRRGVSILVDRVISNLEMRVEGVRLIVRSKSQIALCARNASRKMKIAVGYI